MLYYEILHPTRQSISRPSLEPGIYAYDIQLPDGEMAAGIIAYSANRIWRNQDNTVTYVKNRNGDSINWEVDMAEFTWIKLTARKLP